MIKKNFSIISYTFIFLCACVFLSNNPVWGGVNEELNRLNELKEKLRQERITRVNDKVAGYNQLKSLEMKVYSSEDELTELKVKKINLEEELNTLELEKEEIQTEFNKLETKEKELKDFLIDKCDVLEEKVKNSSFYLKDERLKKLSSLQDLLKNGDLKKGFTQLFEILKEEFTLGQVHNFHREKIEEKDVKILNIGGIFAVYKTTDGKVGLLEKSSQKDKVIYHWNKNIKSSLKEKINNLFTSIENGEKKFFILPLDVTQGTKSKETGISKGSLWRWFVKGGPVMIPLGIIALTILIMVIERLITFRREHTDADRLMEKVLEIETKEGHKNEAIELCKTTPGPVARMLFIGLQHHHRGKKVVEESLHEQHLQELPRLEKYLSAIGVMAGIAPLLGLLGTVSGMISTFQVITYHGGGDPRLLAGGISEALITTEAGLIIAIPALLLHNYLSNKADKIASDMEKNAVRLINSLTD